MSKRIGVIDCGSGNLFKVNRALHTTGCQAELISTPDKVRNMDAILLPGVGAFSSGMTALKEAGIDEALIEFSATGKSMLGICLGMQFLMSFSDEFGRHAGLNLIPGAVIEIKYASQWPVPNVGWSDVTFIRDPKETPFAGASNGTDFYFVHSFHCVPDHDEDCLATIQYGAQKLTAIVSHENIHGCQFHPELSEQAGLNIFKWLAK